MTAANKISLALAAGVTGGFAVLAAVTRQPVPFALGLGVSGLAALPLLTGSSDRRRDR